jgi:hypothetical protein
MDFDLESKVEELIELWPKKRDKATKDIERKYLLSVINTEEIFLKIKNIIEIKIEDIPVPKLTSLYATVKYQLGLNQESGSLKENKTQPAVKTEYVKPVIINPNKETEKVFNFIWEIWPRNPDFVERRQPALEAFSSASKVFALPDLQTACSAYADSFNEASANYVYSKTLKNFVSDGEMVEHWLETASIKTNNKVGKEVFEAAYAWYPDFTNKKADKTKEAAWVHYWRNVSPEDRLDFNAACRCYRQKRRSAWWAAGGVEISTEEISMYTRGFATFVQVWKEAAKTDIYTINELVEAKHGMVSLFLIEELKRQNLDVINIFGWNDGPFFANMVLKYYFSKGLSIKDGILAGLRQVPKVVDEKLNSKEYIMKIKDRELAKSQLIGYDAEKMAASVYQKLLDVKLTEMPAEREPCLID